MKLLPILKNIDVRKEHFLRKVIQTIENTKETKVIFSAIENVPKQQVNLWNLNMRIKYDYKDNRTVKMIINVYSCDSEVVGVKNLTKNTKDIVTINTIQKFLWDNFDKLKYADVCDKIIYTIKSKLFAEMFLPVDREIYVGEIK